MSCCSGKCGCGDACKCGSGCNGCGMYPDVEAAGSNTVLLVTAATHKAYVLASGPRSAHASHANHAHALAHDHAHIAHAPSDPVSSNVSHCSSARDLGVFRCVRCVRLRRAYDRRTQLNLTSMPAKTSD
ncbi:hypothetical protein QYE76_058382 [Lolium multiflorum]|uniref:Metallothionein-like protein n=1 Tax=Lolium multiflorum TaxID=4521 RepID=A0AAD8WRK3_LOLMU|nr:hypothetical protein QYE76_058382 [Lolium multiflorum]